MGSLFILVSANEVAMRQPQEATFKYFRMKLLNKDSRSTGKQIKEKCQTPNALPAQKNVKGAVRKGRMGLPIMYSWAERRKKRGSDLIYKYL